MKLILKDNRRHFLRLDKGEELLASVGQFCASQSIQAAYFDAIGTTSLVELGFFNDHLQEYRHKQFMENLEIVSLSGNVSQVSGQPILHTHGSFARTDFTVIGGHVFKLVTLATCEVFLLAFEGQMRRELNPEFKLNLLA